jgi:hypothetical protein
MSRRTLYAIGEVALIGTLIFGGVKGCRELRMINAVNSFSNRINDFSMEQSSVLKSRKDIEEARRLKEYDPVKIYNLSVGSR